MLIALILFIVNFRKITRLSAIEIIQVCSVLAIAVAAHCQGHINLEKEYGYDPVGAILA